MKYKEVKIRNWAVLLLLEYGASKNIYLDFSEIMNSLVKESGHSEKEIFKLLRSPLEKAI